MRRFVNKLIVCVCLIGFVGVCFGISDGDVAKITSAAPAKAAATPKEARKILVFSLCQGYKHSSIPYCSKALEVLGSKTGAYTSDDTMDKSVFNADNLKQYNAIIFNNTTKLTFNVDQRKAIMDFVKGGKGIVGIHAATDNFYEWPEAAAMMGGVFDGHPWGGGGTWDIRIEDAGHRLTKSFAGKDFSVKDEIYRTKVIDLRENARVIVGLDMGSSVNLSAKGIRPGENDIAISWLRDFGKGRVFYCSFGHDHAIFWNKAILEHYLAGIQFAMGDLDADTTPLKFDGSYLTSIDRLLASVAKFEDGQSRAALIKVADAVVKASGDESSRVAVEAELIGFFKGDTTQAAKQFVCRQLSLIGSGASAKVLGGLVVEESTSDMARYAAERIPGAQIDGMLINAMYKTSGDVRIGIVNSLGVRKTAGAVVMIAEMINKSDEKLSLAAIETLKQINNAEAMAALAKKKDVFRGTLHVAVMDGYLSCVDGLLAAGDTKKAARAYKEAYRLVESDAIRIAAVRGMLNAAGKDKAKVIVDVLKGDDGVAQVIVLSAVRELKLAAIKPVLAKFKSLSDASKVQLIAAVGDMKSDAVLATVSKAASSKSDAVRLAAIKALAAVGDGGSVKLLAEIAAKSKGNEQSIARASLYGIASADADAAIVKTFVRADADVKIELLKAVAARKIEKSKAMLLKGVQDRDVRVRVEALKAVSVVGNLQLVEMLDVLTKAATDSERRLAVNTIITVVNAKGNKTEDARQIVELMPYFEKKGVDVTVAALSVLGGIGDECGYDTLVKALSSKDAKVQRAAIDGLSKWPDAKAADVLKSVVSDGLNQSNKVMAFRGFVTQIGKLRGDRAIELYAEAINIAPADSEKRRVLSALGSKSSKAAMDMAADYLGDAQLGGEAEIAVMSIASKMGQSAGGDSKAILRKLIASSSNESVKKQARATIENIDKFAGYIFAWEIAGPYNKVSAFDTAFAPEKGAAGIEWKLVGNDAGKGSFIFDLGKIIGGDNRAVYARTNVFSPKKQKVRFELGSDDGAKVWVNGGLVHANNAVRPVQPGGDKFEAKLNEGWNTVMVKIAQVAGQWGFCVRIIGLDGQAVEGLKFNVEKTRDPFAGNWQGTGEDSEGNKYAFAAKVIARGDGKYRMLVLDKIDSKERPMHVMDGELKGNKFPHTADDGLYVGGGELGNEIFKGYYKGPVDGSYQMTRLR